MYMYLRHAAGLYFASVPVDMVCVLQFPLTWYIYIYQHTAGPMHIQIHGLRFT